MVEKMLDRKLTNPDYPGHQVVLATEIPSPKSISLVV
jgi:hypothetical protein